MSNDLALFGHMKCEVMVVFDPVLARDFKVAYYSHVRT